MNRTLAAVIVVASLTPLAACGSTKAAVGGTTSGSLAQTSPSAATPAHLCDWFPLDKVQSITGITTLTVQSDARECNYTYTPAGQNIPAFIGIAINAFSVADQCHLASQGGQGYEDDPSLGASACDYPAINGHTWTFAARGQTVDMHIDVPDDVSTDTQKTWATALVALIKGP